MITVCFRAGKNADAWGGARLVSADGKITCGLAAAVCGGEDGHAPHLLSFTWMATVTEIGLQYEVQMGRDRRGSIHVDTDVAPLTSHSGDSRTGPIGDVTTLPAITACIVRTAVTRAPQE